MSYKCSNRIKEADRLLGLLLPQTATMAAATLDDVDGNARSQILTLERR